MCNDAIRQGDEADVSAPDAAAQAVSKDLGDPDQAKPETLGRVLFDTPPSASAQIADGPAGTRGIVPFSPVFSTVRGGAGRHVSDVWIDTAERGKGLGPALLQRGAALWEASSMRLAVYSDKRRARALYDALGFEPGVAEISLVLTGRAFQHMRGPR